MTVDPNHLHPETRRCMDLPAVQALRDQCAAPISLARVAMLYREARERGGYDARSALTITGTALTGSRTATEALHRLREMLPGPKPPVVDGTLIRVVLPIGVPSRELVAGRSGDVNTREMAARYTLAPGCRVLWQHQRGDVWARDRAEVGRILAHRASVVGDLETWVRITHADLAEQAAFGLLAASPGISNASEATYGFSSRDREPTRVWGNAVIAELSLTPVGTEALTVSVTAVRGVPADATTWATAGPADQHQRQRQPDPAPDRQPVYRTSRGPAGETVQHRTFAHLPGLHVRR